MEALQHRLTTRIMDDLDAAMERALSLQDAWKAQGHEEGFQAGAARGHLEGRALGRVKVLLASRGRALLLSG